METRTVSPSTELLQPARRTPQAARDALSAVSRENVGRVQDLQHGSCRLINDHTIHPLS